MTMCSISLEEALFVTKLFLDGWEKLLSEDVFIYHFLFIAVFLGIIMRERTPLSKWPTAHINGLRMLYSWHDTGLMLMLTCSFLDKVFLEVPNNRKGCSLEEITLP